MGALAQPIRFAARQAGRKRSESLPLLRSSADVRFYASILATLCTGSKQKTFWQGELKMKVLGLVLSVGLLFSGSLRAQQFYISNEPQQSLELLNIATGQITTLFHIGARPDDLILNAQGKLLYSVPSMSVNGVTTGNIYIYDPVAKTNSILVGNVKGARDMIIEPGGKSMLIAIYSPAKILRFTFSTGVTTVLAQKLGTVDGIAYDAQGHLFAVANHNTIVQIDPVAGTVLKTLVLEAHHSTNGGDGMTFDTYTGELWVCHDGTTGSGLLEIPTDLSTFKYYDFSTQIHAPDGIKSDGKGNLYVGALWTAAVFNIQLSTPTLTHSFVVKGADGVSLVPGTY
jgi:sugar lactone lactonase YvrE